MEEGTHQSLPQLEKRSSSLTMVAKMADTELGAKAHSHRLLYSHLASQIVEQLSTSLNNYLFDLIFSTVFFVAADNTKIIFFSHLEMTTNRRNFPALFVRLLHKSRLRYYGKPDKKMIEPYYVYASSLKKSLHELQDPPTNIAIIPERQVKPKWRLTKLNHCFITRSELDAMPEKQICDVIGILVFVGKVQQLKKKGKLLKLKLYRWILIADGTSEQPFIVELFSTSQPEIFENIYPMTFLVCTQLKFVRNNTQVPKLLLTTRNKSRVFLTAQQFLCIYFIGYVIYFLFIKLIFTLKHSTTR
ncbi:LOW QUALITY PROTEIN: RPA-related protein RADX [Molossus nigricans]